jgi:cold shock CspA family protein
MIGTVNNSNFGYAFISGHDGTLYFAHATQMPEDEIGRHFLLSGEAVTFDTAPPRNGTRTALAVNVQLVVPREKVDLSGYFEEGEVSKVGFGYAFVLRPFGGVAFLHWENVKHYFGQSAKTRVRFCKGQKWRFEVASPRGTRQDEPWLAVNAVEI